MSTPKKRTRTLAGKTSSNGITIRPITDKQGYVSHLVQGWKENGKWQRIQFKKREDAETFASTKRVEMENKGRAQRMILSPMSKYASCSRMGTWTRVSVLKGGSCWLEMGSVTHSRIFMLDQMAS